MLILNYLQLKFIKIDDLSSLFYWQKSSLMIEFYWEGSSSPSKKKFGLCLKLLPKSFLSRLYMFYYIHLDLWFQFILLIIYVIIATNMTFIAQIFIYYLSRITNVVDKRYAIKFDNLKINVPLSVYKLIEKCKY